jgi:hypothetical protein
MSLVEIQWNPSPRQLRQFTGIGVVAAPLIAWLWGADAKWVAVLLSVASLVAVVAWIRPNWVKPLFVAASLITAPSGLIVGEVTMWLIFAIVFCPLGLLFRIIGRDVLRRTIEVERDSYWEPKEQAKTVASYYRQS